MVAVFWTVPYASDGHGGNMKKFKIGDMVIAMGYKRARKIKAIDGKYVFVTGIGWGEVKNVTAAPSGGKR